MQVFNTLTGQKEEFTTKNNTITMYVCGVTVYDDCHIGHAMSYVIFDTIRRYLEFKGYQVTYIQNFTDIDDKIINRARELGLTAQELAGKYIDEYFKDMDMLNIRHADTYPKATEEIPKMIEIIQGLIEKGYAYNAQGSVYFRVNNFPEYGKLSHQNIEEMTSRSAGEADEKESALDFALWKAAKPGEPSWQSPWGEGRPGWHIECSAMALTYLGSSIDIHGGGQDLVFPHHENEIAQSESFTGITPFARYWLHNGLLQLSGDKMSKSLGNLVTVKEIEQRFSPDAIRFFILSSHYRTPLTYSEEIIEAAEIGIERLRQAATGLEDDDKGNDTLDGTSYQQKFIESMDDDFNTAQAIAVLFDLAREINRGRAESVNITQAQNTLRELANILGFTLNKPDTQPIDPESLITILLTVRSELRQAKQWELADVIRKQMADIGILLEDTPKGTIWKRSR